MNTTAFRPVVVIPVFDHEHAVGAMVDGVLRSASSSVASSMPPSCSSIRCTTVCADTWCSPTAV